jgi:hypothetical protein
MDHNDIPMAWGLNELVDIGTLDDLLANSEQPREDIQAVTNRNHQSSSLPSTHHNPYNSYNSHTPYNSHNAYSPYSSYNSYSAAIQHLSRDKK